MDKRPNHTPASREKATLGRLGGLGSREADRGEKALWLAGGGYRAALFHLGALTRLNELGLLAKLGTVGAVSGGSIVAALLATRVPWPLQGAYRDWPEQVAEPMRGIARRNARARALFRRPFPGVATDAGLEERYARELAAELDGESRWGPRFVFGASGLTLSGLAAGWEECLEWKIGDDVHPHGYEPTLVEETIAAVRTDLDAFSEAEQAVLENHGYMVADAALRERGMTNAIGIHMAPPEPPHPDWVGAAKVRRALAASSRRTRFGRLRPRRGAGGGRKRQPARAELTQLLERYRPLLHYDSLESCRADSAETICTLTAPGRCNTLHRADGALIAAACPLAGEPRLELGFLGGPTYANGEPAREDDYLDECGGSHVGDALAARRPAGRADVAYGRARRDDDGRLWLQYWFFHYYADRGLLGLEQHEGDWQMIQIRLGEDARPEEATFAQHHEAERLRWEELTLAGTEDGPVPVVFPARGSHAPRPRAGSHGAPVVADHNDGRGPRVRPRLVTIADDGPSWVLWPGRWGSTRRREYFEGESPRGPRAQTQWWDPAEMHAEAQPWPRSGATLLPPPRPRFDLRREANLAVVSYELPDPAADEAAAARLVAAPFDDSPEPSASRSFAVEGQRGRFALTLSGERRWRGVRLAVNSESGVSGETLEAPFVEG